MKKYILILFVLIISISCQAQKEATENKPKNIQKNETPKLVVGIVVDQMRYD